MVNGRMRACIRLYASLYVFVGVQFACVRVFGCKYINLFLLGIETESQVRNL